MYCTLKNYDINLPNIIFDGNILENAECHKHLGIVLQKNLAFDEHVNEICQKANKRIDILASLKYKLDRNIHLKRYINPLLGQFLNTALLYGIIVQIY